MVIAIPMLRLRDEVRADGTFVRMTDCRHCGRAEIPFPASILAEELRLELEATLFGGDCGG